MRNFINIFMVLAVASGLVQCVSNQTDTERNPSQVSSATVSREQALVSFLYVHQIATGNRCTNCHVSGERPIQLEGLARRFHNMNVQRKIVELGHSCQTCHQESNLDKPHLPPGAPHWGLPRGHKAVTAATTPRQLCELWLDPTRNEFETGANTDQPRTSAQLLEHVKNDPLVIWTWNPGPGRTPSAGTHAEFVKNFSTWVEGGTPCPTE